MLHFSQVFEAIKEKHPKFSEQCEERDAEIFVSIPCILILIGIDDEDKGLCCQFCPEIFKNGTECNKIFKELKELLGGNKISDDFELYNYIEKTVLDMEPSPEIKSKLLKEHLKIELILQKIKWLAMQVSRADPTEWNLFLDVLLIS